MTEPKWLTEARKHIGKREVAGPASNPWIVRMWQRIGWGAVYKSDGIPWCGGFVADCMLAAGVTPPKTAPRALDWSTWGVPCPPQVGAVVTMGRKGGGHVCFLVGQHGDYYLCLGGNQGDAVTVAAFPKSRINAIRWPSTVAQRNIALPTLPMATVSTREA